ncbi:helix-turn-helix transcriptional regulator [Caulobacter hibisci]|uniref:Helix-turn-helix domain-containing protein n=1 Tax=Caulobacter hibisci TaxID=2035993 RepID=A0ABS0T4H0_9CAUL|nr:helix-turn-helix domain-containing protein [Caulobacter hibisci]MBI1686785.1 helix-turn-helix domain-containing protein [Caulobacter hibisci]
MPSDTQLPMRRLSTPEAARFVGLSNRTLEKHRSYGTGPVYEKIGGRVVYAVADLEAWLARGRRSSTSERTAEVVLPAKAHAATSAFAGLSGARK